MNFAKLSFKMAAGVVHKESLGHSLVQGRVSLPSSLDVRVPRPGQGNREGESSMHCPPVPHEKHGKPSMHCSLVLH